MATLQQIKNANSDFFSQENNDVFGTHKVTKKRNVITLHNKHGLDHRYVKPDLSLVYIHSDAGQHYILDANNRFKKRIVSIETGQLVE